jgi:hypothetical protein
MTAIGRKGMSDWLRQKIRERSPAIQDEDIENMSEATIERLREDFSLEEMEGRSVIAEEDTAPGRPKESEEFGPEPEPNNVGVRGTAEGQRELYETQDHQEPSTPPVRAEQRQQMAERINKEQPKEPYDQIVELFKEKVKAVDEEHKGEIEEDVSRERSKEITGFYRALERVQDYIKEHHRKELWVKDEYYRSLHWISGDELISTALKKTKFFEVAHYLDTHNLDRESLRTLKLAKGAKHATVVQSGEQKGQKVQYDYALILANKEFFRRASEKLRLSEISIKKYFQHFCEIGLLKKVVRTGREWLYADGYWLKWNKTKKPRKIRFLKDNPETRDALRNFRLSAKT